MDLGRNPKTYCMLSSLNECDQWGAPVTALRTSARETLADVDINVWECLADERPIWYEVAYRRQRQRTKWLTGEPGGTRELHQLKSLPICLFCQCGLEWYYLVTKNNVQCDFSGDTPWSHETCGCRREFFPAKLRSRSIERV